LIEKGPDQPPPVVRKQHGIGRNTPATIQEAPIGRRNQIPKSR